MSFGALRSIIRPVSRTLFSSPIKSAFSPATFHPAISPLPSIKWPWFPASSSLIHSLTDTRFPKRRPVDKPRKKRSSLRPSGPYAWVKYTPVVTQPSATPNQGSSNQKNVKRRNEKKRIKQRHSFIMSEKRKRKVLMQEAKRKKIIKRVERKMSAVARDRAWAIRLAELQRLEEEKAAATA